MTIQNNYQSILIELLAVLVTLISGILTVLFSSDSYDAWDALIAAFVLSVIYIFRELFFKSSWLTFVTASVSAAIAITILMMVLATLTLRVSCVAWGISSTDPSCEQYNFSNTHCTWRCNPEDGLITTNQSVTNFLFNLLEYKTYIFDSDFLLSFSISIFTFIYAYKQRFKNFKPTVQIPLCDDVRALIPEMIQEDQTLSDFISELIVNKHHELLQESQEVNN